MGKLLQNQKLTATPRIISSVIASSKIRDSQGIFVVVLVMACDNFAVPG